MKKPHFPPLPSLPSINPVPACSAKSKVKNQKSKFPFALRRGLGVWELTLGNEHAILKHERGLDYVAWLMAHPGESIHALDLAARIAAQNGKHDGITEIIDPRTGKVVTVESHSRIQERGLALDDAQTMRAVLRKQAQLEAYVEDEDVTDPERIEAYRDLVALYDYETARGPRVRDAAQKASDAVGRAIKRLYQRLSRSTGLARQPNPLLRLFGQHIKQQILLPSGRGANGGRRAARDHGGYLIYTLF